ncbi:MAG: M20/M25/M40 family metallo-hydrolase [Bacteroidales bacterium]|nr:M20/M25/M40 family metallo-hydrolase [Bacteroidales bacterium]
MTEQDLQLFLEFLSIDSTTGRERAGAEWLTEHLKTPANRVETFEVGDGSLNVLFSWGTPKVFFCSHCDTVPPYIPPTRREDRIEGRGTCDAKGQIFSMFLACRALEAMGRTDFGLLVLAGEETGSFGAKAWTRDCPGGEIVIVGEPTDGAMVTASKGTQSFAMRFRGIPCHSGYPQLGRSAIDLFLDFTERLRSAWFPKDPELGETTWNIGLLSSDNPQNILSPEVSCRVYFRTTFASHAFVQAWMEEQISDDVEVIARGGDTPMHYLTVPGLPTTTVAFGSDAPQLHKFEKRILCGPGSIVVAHTAQEHILLADLETAVARYITMAKTLLDCPGK